MQSPPNDTGAETGTSTLTNELGSDAQKLGSSAVDRVHSELDARKGAAVEQVKSLSSAIGGTAGGLDDKAPEWLKSSLQKAAQQVQGFADTLEHKDSRQIMNDVQTLARDNPGTFLAGCAALGFAAARVFKAGTPENSSTQARQPQFPPAQVNKPSQAAPGAETNIAGNRSGALV